MPSTESFNVLAGLSRGRVRACIGRSDSFAQPAGRSRFTSLAGLSSRRAMNFEWRR
jgi:hypothetical protein